MCFNELEKHKKIADNGIEPLSSVYEADVLTIILIRIINYY